MSYDMNLNSSYHSPDGNYYSIGNTSYLRDSINGGFSRMEHLPDGSTRLYSSTGRLESEYNASTKTSRLYDSSGKLSSVYDGRSSTFTYKSW